MAAAEPLKRHIRETCEPVSIHLFAAGLAWRSLSPTAPKLRPSFSKGNCDWGVTAAHCRLIGELGGTSIVGLRKLRISNAPFLQALRAHPWSVLPA